MTAIDQEALQEAFDDHPSLSASLEDFEHNGTFSETNAQTSLHIPSHHSGFYQSDDGESEMPESVSSGPWSPPAAARFDVRMRGREGVWDSVYRSERTRRSRSPDERRSRSPARSSREASPQYEDALDDLEGDTMLPANIRLPSDSPERRSPSPKRSASPSLYPDGGPDFGKKFGEAEVKANASGPGAAAGAAADNTSTALTGAAAAAAAAASENSNNYIRFAVRAEVQHRTEPFEAALAYFRHQFDRLTSSRTSTFLSVVLGLTAYVVLRLLFQPPLPGPVPDLVKVAGLAKSFEPLIFYSENGVLQIGELQETGLAVWDLGESVRSSNMTSAPIIVKQLDELSETLKTLALELTRFFANVDGDMDGILLVMDWAKRELSQISNSPATSVSSAIDNIHTVFCRVGLLESATGEPTRAGGLVTGVFGASRLQRTRQTLQRTFNEFLAVLEESIASELRMSIMLYGMFDSIDQQFLNLARTVIREFDQQEREEGEMLSTLWSQLLGPNAGALRKFERNKKLLANVRARTLNNKGVLNGHTSKLMTLKANLETLRKKLVSPLVRSNDSSTLTVEEQILGLDGTYQHLRTVRERQKGKLMEMLYGVGSKRSGLSRLEETMGIDQG